MLKVVFIVSAITALVGLAFHLLRKIIKHSFPLAIAAGIVLTAFIAPVATAHALGVLLLVAMFALVLV